MLRSQTYEITFTGQVGRALREKFDDCQVTPGAGTTTLRAELPDQPALAGLLERITGLGLEVIDLHLLADTEPTLTGNDHAADGRRPGERRS